MSNDQKIFRLVSDYKPAGDQPEAIANLLEGLEEHKEHQVLLGVTGSGKTFTIANVIEKANRPVLILSHNKTLASQLYSELKGFVFWLLQTRSLFAFKRFIYWKNFTK